MAEKDVDEQFAAIMAHWDDEALGLDPYGDPRPEVADEADADDASPAAAEPAAVAEVLDDNPADATALPTPAEARRTREVADLPAVDEEEGADLGDDAPGSGWRTSEYAAEVEEEHYTPPPPAPLPPSEDKHFWLMITALVVGPLMFLYLLLFNRDGNGWWMLFALLVSIAGFVLLVLRSPAERDEDDHGIRL